jgi:hypothetical protein
MSMIWVRAVFLEVTPRLAEIAGRVGIYFKQLSVFIKRICRHYGVRLHDSITKEEIWH